MNTHFIIVGCSTCGGGCPNDTCSCIADTNCAPTIDATARPGLCGDCAQLPTITLGRDSCCRQAGDPCDRETETCCAVNGVAHECDDAVCVPMRGR